MYDYHMHTSFSDGRGSYQQYALQAEEKGLKEIGFSDHLCLHYPKWAIPAGDISAMSEQLQDFLKSYQGPLSIRFGAEVDYIPGKEDEIKEMLNFLPLDYAIGSVHYIGSWNFDTSTKLYPYLDLDEVYRAYYKLVGEAIDANLFQIIAHFDLPKKFGYYPENNQDEYIIDCLKRAADKDVCIELNTNGMNKPCRDFYPSKDILTMAYEMGVPVSLGSDAHQPENVGQYFQDAIRLLKSIGFKSIRSFSNMKFRDIALP